MTQNNSNLTLFQVAFQQLEEKIQALAEEKEKMRQELLQERRERRKLEQEIIAKAVLSEMKNRELDAEKEKTLKIKHELELERNLKQEGAILLQQEQQAKASLMEQIQMERAKVQQFQEVEHREKQKVQQELEYQRLQTQEVTLRLQQAKEDVKAGIRQEQEIKEAIQTNLKEEQHRLVELTTKYLELEQEKEAIAKSSQSDKEQLTSALSQLSGKMDKMTEKMLVLRGDLKKKTEQTEHFEKVATDLQKCSDQQEHEKKEQMQHIAAIKEQLEQEVLLKQELEIKVQEKTAPRNYKKLAPVVDYEQQELVPEEVGSQLEQDAVLRSEFEVNGEQVEQVASGKQDMEGMTEQLKTSDENENKMSLEIQKIRDVQEQRVVKRQEVQDREKELETGRVLIKEGLNEQQETRTTGTKQNEGKKTDDENIHQVADISPYYTYKVKITVELVGNIRQIKKNSFQGRVLNCILSDGSGQIKLSAFSREGESNVEEMQEQLKEGSVYILSGAKVKVVSDTKYNRTGHMFEMVWTNKTKVELLPGEEIHLPYNVQPLSQVAVSQEGCLLDVIGVVKEVKPCTTTPSRSKNKLYHLCEVVLEDSSGTAVLNLWESKAIELPDINGKVLAVRRGQVQEHEGKRSLSIMFTGSYEVEPALVAGVLELVKQYQGSLSEQQPLNIVEGGKDGDKDGKEQEQRGGRKRKLTGNTELEGDREEEEGRMIAKMPALSSKEGKAQRLVGQTSDNKFSEKGRPGIGRRASSTVRHLCTVLLYNHKVF